MTSMEVDGAGTSSARRRRERRLRSWWRHERMSVAAALAEAHHHSAPKVGAETHYALRRQKTASAGARPGVLKDPAPQGAVTVGYVAAPGPLLCTPLLADTTADGVDAGALAFLTRAALEAQEEEERRVQLAQAKAERREQRVRRQEMVDELAELLRASLPSQRTPSVVRRISELRSSLEASSSSMPSMSRRKRKKRRKKRLPRCHGCRRPCVHQRQVPAVRFSPLLALGTPVVTQRQVPTVHSFILPVQLLDKVGMPVVVLRQVPGLMVQKTVEPPQFQFIFSRRHPLRSAEADPHGPVCSADHRDSSVAVRFQVVDDPVVLVVRFHRLFISVYSALLGSTVDTNFASVYGEFHVFLREKVDYGS